MHVKENYSCTPTRLLICFIFTNSQLDSKGTSRIVSKGTSRIVSKCKDSANAPPNTSRPTAHLGYTWQNDALCYKGHIFLVQTSTFKSRVLFE
jgi:hypothetical protein